MKKENSIGIMIIVAFILLFLILIFIWLLTRSKQGQTTSYGPTPTLSALQKSRNNSSSSKLSSNLSLNSNNNTVSSTNQIAENTSSSSNNSPMTILGNQYERKNYSEYLSPEQKKKEAEIQNSMSQLFPNTQSSTTNTQTGSQDGKKQINLLLKLFNTFFSVPNIDSSTFDIVLPTITPLPSVSNQSPPISLGLLSGKMGIFILSEYSPGTKQIVLSKPRIIKVMDPQSNNTLQAVKDFKEINPQGITVLRFYVGTSGIKFTLENDPKSAAQTFFQLVVQPALLALGDNKQLFDFIETPNELDNTPGWESTENTTWLNSFWIQLVELYSENGLRTCVASIPVGNPPGDYAQIKAELSPFLPALQKVKELGGAFCYHAYTLNFTTDVNQEIQTSLRYRQIHQAISELDGSLSSLPFILSEAGVDKNGDPKTSGWNARGSESDFANWLSWFNGQINQDSYVLGATLYQIGDNHWSSFNIESLADWISKSL